MIELSISSWTVKRSTVVLEWYRDINIESHLARPRNVSHLKNIEGGCADQ